MSSEQEKSDHTTGSLDIEIGILNDLQELNEELRKIESSIEKIGAVMTNIADRYGALLCLSPVHTRKHYEGLAREIGLVKMTLCDIERLIKESQ